LPIDEDFTVFAVGVFQKEVERGLCIDVEALFGGATGGKSVPKRVMSAGNFQNARGCKVVRQLRCDALRFKVTLWPCAWPVPCASLRRLARGELKLL
jgi:hypothetical protein